MSHPEPRSAHPGARWEYAGLTFLPEAVGAPSGRFPDFSEFQGAVDWSALGAAFVAGQLDAVAIRAGFGTVRADAQFATNQREARARRIPAIYYWFTYPAYNAPQAEAAMFNATVGPLQPGEAMCGDFEDDPSARPFPRGQAGVDWCRAFLTALQAPQNATWWYTYPFLLSTVGLQPLLGSWPFWIADYSATPDSAFSGPIARQFTDCGSTPGVGGCSDQSRVLQAPLGQWLTGGARPAPDPITTGGGNSMLRIPGATPDSFHLFGVRSNQLVRASTLSGGLGALEGWLAQPGNGWVSHGAPEGHRLIAGTEFGGRGPDGKGGVRLEVGAQDETGQAHVICIGDDGSEEVEWTALAVSVLDLPGASASDDDDGHFVTHDQLKAALEAAANQA